MAKGIQGRSQNGIGSLFRTLHYLQVSTGEHFKFQAFSKQGGPETQAICRCCNSVALDIVGLHRNCKGPLRGGWFRDKFAKLPYTNYVRITGAPTRDYRVVGDTTKLAAQFDLLIDC